MNGVISNWVGGFRGRRGSVGFVDGMIGNWVSGFLGWRDRRWRGSVGFVDGVG